MSHVIFAAREQQRLDAVNALYFLVDTFARLYLLTFLLRIMLQVARADFYNPISQFIMRVTNPLVVPARRLLPSLRSFDLPTLVVLVVVQMAVALLLLALRGLVPAKVDSTPFSSMRRMQ